MTNKFLKPFAIAQLLYGFIGVHQVVAGCIEAKPDLYNYMGAYGAKSSTTFFQSDNLSTECIYLGGVGLFVKTNGGDEVKVHYKCTGSLYLLTADSRSSILNGGITSLLSNGRLYRANLINDQSRCPIGAFNSPDCSRLGDSTWIQRETTCEQTKMIQQIKSRYTIEGTSKSFGLRVVTETSIRKN